MSQHRTINGSSRLHAMRLCFDDNNLVIPNQIEVRNFSCICRGCSVGSVCLDMSPENAWKAVRLQERANAILDRNEEEDSDHEVNYESDDEPDNWVPCLILCKFSASYNLSLNHNFQTLLDWNPRSQLNKMAGKKRKVSLTILWELLVESCCVKI